MLGKNSKPRIDIEEAATYLTNDVNECFQKITILDIDAEAGGRVESSVEKSYGEKKVHFVHVDVSNYDQMTGKHLDAFKLNCKL